MEENPYQSPLSDAATGSGFRLVPVGRCLFALALVAWVASVVSLTSFSRIGYFLAATLALLVAYIVWDLLGLIDFRRGLE